MKEIVSSLMMLWLFTAALDYGGIFVMSLAKGKARFYAYCIHSQLVGNKRQITSTLYKYAALILLGIVGYFVNIRTGGLLLYFTALFSTVAFDVIMLGVVKHLTAPEPNENPFR